MADDSISRRGFLGKTAAAGAAALAGCNTPESRNQDSDPKENNTVSVLEPENTSHQEAEMPSNETEGQENTTEAYGEAEFRGHAEIIESELWNESYQGTEDWRLTTSNFDNHDMDSINVRLDFNSVLDKAKRMDRHHHIEKDQDFFKLIATDNMDNVLEDVKSQLEEVENTVYSQTQDFLSNYDVPEDRDYLDVTIELMGANDTSVSTGWMRAKPGEEPEIHRDLDEVKEDWSVTGRDEPVGGMTWNPSNYDELGYIPSGEEATISDGKEEYTIEVLHTRDGSAAIRLNDELQEISEGDRIYTDDVSLESVDPMYMEDGVELRFNEDIDYLLSD